MAQERKRETHRPQPKTYEEETPRITDQAHMEKVDDLLDEIDTVLEENAEEFVKNYVQKGGE